MTEEAPATQVIAQLRAGAADAAAQAAAAALLEQQVREIARLRRDLSSALKTTLKAAESLGKTEVAAVLKQHIASVVAVVPVGSDTYTQTESAVRGS